MIGAIIGDIVGSRFEFNNHRSKEFELFTKDCFVTDDSIMTIAVAKAIMESHGDDLSENAVKYMQAIGRLYPNCGYGGSFGKWIYSEHPQPYNSYGNGAAMRISPVAYVARDMWEVGIMSRAVTSVTHNHKEGIKGAECTAACVWAGLNGWSMDEIKRIAERYYDVEFTLDEIRPKYKFNETCQHTVPQAIVAFLESVDFEDAIRNAISIGGDSDTLAAITGSIAEAYYGVPARIRKKAIKYIPADLLAIVEEFEKMYERGADV